MIYENNTLQFLVIATEINVVCLHLRWPWYGRKASKDGVTPRTHIQTELNHLIYKDGNTFPTTRIVYDSLDKILETYVIHKRFFLGQVAHWIQTRFPCPSCGNKLSLQNIRKRSTYIYRRQALFWNSTKTGAFGNFPDSF